MIMAYKVVLLASAIFAAGALTGALVSSRLGSRDSGQMPGPAGASSHGQGLAKPVPNLDGSAAEPRRKDRGGPRQPGAQRLEFLRHLEEAIPMDPQQRDRIRSLVQESERRIQREWEPVMPRIRSELRDLNRSIESELRPDQRALMDAALGRRANRRSHDAPDSVR